MDKKKFRFAVRKFGPFESAMQKIWDSYCSYAGCELEAEFVAMDLPELHQATITDGGLKNGDWDAAHIVTDWLLEAHTNGALEDLKPWMAQHPPEDFPAGWSNSLLEMQQFKDAVVGLPFHDGPECLIYRKDLFEDPQEQISFKEKYNKDLKVPETWEDFITIARFFQRSERDLYGTVVAAYPDGHNTVFDFCLQLWTRGGKLISEDGKINIHTKEALEGIEFYRNLLKDKDAIHPGSGEYESVAAGQAFARGEVAMMINWFGFAAVCEVSEEIKVKGKVDVAGIPRGDHGKSASLNVYWLYAIGSGSQHKEIAYDFISYATNMQNDKLLTLEGGIGCRKSTWKDEEINEVIPYYHKLKMLHEHAQTLPQRANWSAIAEVIDELVTKAVGAEEALDTLLAQAQHKIELIENR
jgi:multiple sugar transport system substrate-binding protein